MSNKIALYVGFDEKVLANPMLEMPHPTRFMIDHKFIIP